MIEIKNLVKIFNTKNKSLKGKRAVDNLSLSIEKGEIFGLLGPNGAGKTTTLSMISMLTSSTSGDIKINGLDTKYDEVAIKKIIGMVPQHINFDYDLTVWENLELHGRLHHMDKKERRARIQELLAYVNLLDRQKDKVKTLSGGMKRRLLIVRALMHKPKILFLDEPTVALDPQVRRKIWDLIRQLPSQGVTVVLTTHYIEEAQELCSKVAIINHGKLICVDNPNNLAKMFGEYVASYLENNITKYKFFNDKKDIESFKRINDYTISIRKATLEDVFVKLTGEKKQDDL